MMVIFSQQSTVKRLSILEKADSNSKNIKDFRTFPRDKAILKSGIRVIYNQVKNF